MSRPRTHDTSHTYHHVDDVKDLTDALSRAAIASFPNKRQRRYKHVHALLLYWEGDDLGVESEINTLWKVLYFEYGFDAFVEKIPILKSHNALSFQLSAYMADRSRDSQDNLLIVYYGGHAHMDEQKRCVFSR